MRRAPRKRVFVLDIDPEQLIPAQMRPLMELKNREHEVLPVWLASTTIGRLPSSAPAPIGSSRVLIQTRHVLMLAIDARATVAPTSAYDCLAPKAIAARRPTAPFSAKATRGDRPSTLDDQTRRPTAVAESASGNMSFRTARIGRSSTAEAVTLKRTAAAKNLTGLIPARVQRAIR